MDGEAIRELKTTLETSQVKVIEQWDRAWIAHAAGGVSGVKIQEITPHLPAAESFSTLSALVAFAALERYDVAYIKVRSRNTTLEGHKNAAQQRPGLAEVAVNLPDGLKEILRGGLRARPADMIVTLLTEFEDSPSRAELLAVLGNIRSESARTDEDDGVTARVTVTKGIARAAEARLGPLVRLYSQYLLYPDLRESNPAGVGITCVLRLEGGDEKVPPTVSLLAADPMLAPRLVALAVGWLRDRTDIPVLG